MKESDDVVGRPVAVEMPEASSHDDADGLLSYDALAARTEALGFETSARSVRFYAAEGLLEKPLLGGSDPRFAPGYALPTLRTIHVLHERLGRSLPDVRAILRKLEEHPQVLADKVEALYEQVVQTAAEGTNGPAGPLTLDQADQVVDQFCAQLLEGRAPSEVSILDLCQGEALGSSAPASPEEAAARPGGAAAPACEPAPDADAAPASPDPGRTPEAARNLEEQFLARFDDTVQRLCRVPHPLDDALYPSGPRDRIHLKRTRADEIIDLMKRHRVYDRSLLDALPLDEVSEYRVFTRSIFGRRDIRVVLAAACLSPLEELIRTRRARRPEDLAAVERFLDTVSPRPETFYYLGLLSTTSWTDEARAQVPGLRNVLVCLVEPGESSAWRLSRQEHEHWGGIYQIFDPETEREKVERTRQAILAEPELQLRGGHVLVRDVQERLGVSEHVLARAASEVVAQDPDLSIQLVAGRHIVKRRRL